MPLYVFPIQSSVVIQCYNENVLFIWNKIFLINVAMHIMFVVYLFSYCAVKYENKHALLFLKE